MADVRALLRAERAARVPPKPQSQQAPSQSLGKKRKAAEDEDEDEVRKRTRAEKEHNLSSGFSDDRVEDEDKEVQQVEADKLPTSKDAPRSSSLEKGHVEATRKPEETTVDEDEWDAFNREINELPPPGPNPTAAILNSAATISAAPMTAAEIEAQRKKDEQRAQRTRREEELEGEKEDATRTLEEEFEEMEELEKRVTKLKEMRERLGQGSTGGKDSLVQENNSKSLVNGAGAKELDEDDDNTEEEEGDDDDDDDDWSKWGFGRA